MHEPDNYDIIIIGAGIQGAGVAQAAAVCGYKTLVIEKNADAGLATSSKSSKLIHGGLRYLESGQFNLVRECLRERKHLLRNAPHLVKLLPFHIPVYSSSSRPAWLIWLGLFIYSLFSFKLFSFVNKKQWKELDNISLKNLTHVFKYYDAQTDDQQLTQAVISSAIRYGARVIYNAEFIKSETHNDLHQLTYTENENTFRVKSSFIINCSGPWTHLVQNKITPKLNLPDIDLVAGSHIIIKNKLLNGAYYIEAEDRRAVFFLPWKDKFTLIGTTERRHNDSPDNLKPTEEEIIYLLKAYNQHFNRNISREDIHSAFAGLRVLPGNGNSAFKKSRDSLIIKNKGTPGLITIVGGKLTAYRAGAEEIINIVKKRMPIDNTDRPCDTRKIKFN